MRNLFEWATVLLPELRVLSEVAPTNQIKYSGVYKLSGEQSRTEEKQIVGAIVASHKVLTLQALSSSPNASAAKRGCLGQRLFRVTSGSLSPKRPRPFTQYRLRELQSYILETARNPHNLRPQALDRQLNN